MAKSLGFSHRIAGYDGILFPVYICCDVSTSMAQHVDLLNQRLPRLIESVADDPLLDEQILLSIHQFAASAEEIVSQSQPSTARNLSLNFHLAKTTDYGSAFELLRTAIERDIRKLHADSPQAEIYRSLVFFFADGKPSSPAWFESFRSNFTYDPETRSGFKYYPRFFPLGIGDARRDVLKQLAFPPSLAGLGMPVVPTVEDALEVIRATIARAFMAHVDM